MVDVTDPPTDHRSPWVDEHGFLRVRSGSERRTKVALEEDLRKAFELTRNGRRKTILDARATDSYELEVWTTLVQRISRIVSSLAVLVSDSTSPQVLAFVDQIDKLLLPCRAFEDEESAFAWLEPLRI